jgi:hypothetical protein
MLPFCMCQLLRFGYKFLSFHFPIHANLSLKLHIVGSIMPKFQDLATWQQADHLMQPAFIRLVDNLRKQLDQSTWKGTYEEVQVWPENVSAAVQSEVAQLQASLKTASAAEAIAIEAALAKLPSSYPGYHLHLEQQEHRVTVDLWHLCYQICFQNYDAASGQIHAIGESSSDQEVKIDGALFDDVGDVDWHRLDQKTQRLVERTFASLPCDATASADLERLGN